MSKQTETEFLIERLKQLHLEEKRILERLEQVNDKRERLEQVNYKKGWRAKINGKLCR